MLNWQGMVRNPRSTQTLRPRDRDTDTVELTIKTLSSKLAAGKFNSPPKFCGHRMSVSSPGGELRWYTAEGEARVVGLSGP
eukprot:707207-Pyramimonas_sp.AAC.1